MIRDGIFQMAYVTRDIDEAVDRFSASANIRETFRTEANITVRTPQGLEPIELKIAFLWVGDFQYELIQPISGLNSVYGINVPEDGSLSFHHTCTRVSDWEEFRRSVDQMPYPVAFENEGGPVQFLYVDARPQLGHFLEFTAVPSDIWKLTGGR